MGNIDFLNCPSCQKLGSLEVSDEIICGNCRNEFSEEKIVEEISLDFHRKLMEIYEKYAENLAILYSLILKGK